MELRAEKTFEQFPELEKDGFRIVTCLANDALVSELVRNLEESQETGTSFRQRNQQTYAMRNLLNVPAVFALSQSPAIRSVVEPVLGGSAMAVRGILFDKTPEANWKVAWHQDRSIAVQERVDVPGFEAWSIKAGVQHVQPPVFVLENMLTVRLHLDDCGIENGPLQVLPGSHRNGKLNARQISELQERAPAVMCCVLRGGALLMRPLLLHASSPAIKPAHRRVIHLEFASAALPGGLQWFVNESFTETRACL
jgi:ectoine hydroxylase-related dioxygenase (phytanoyl-CoA dioxygenase family)